MENIITDLIGLRFERATMNYSDKFTKNKIYNKTVNNEKFRVFFKKTSFRFEKFNGKRWINLSEKTYRFSEYENGILNTDFFKLMNSFNCC